MMYDQDRSDEIINFKQICNTLCQIHAKKSATYGPSWKKRGELISVFGNLSRKFDRIENIVTDPELFAKSIGGQLGETLEDSVLDLAVYGILWLVFISDNRQIALNKAIKTALGEENGKEE